MPARECGQTSARHGRGHSGTTASGCAEFEFFFVVRNQQAPLPAGVVAFITPIFTSSWFLSITELSHQAASQLVKAKRGSSPRRISKARTNLIRARPPTSSQKRAHSYPSYQRRPRNRRNRDPSRRRLANGAGPPSAVTGRHTSRTRRQQIGTGT